MKNVDSQLSSMQKFEVWFGRNAIKVVLACLILGILSLLLTLKIVSSSNAKQTALLKILERTTRYSIVATPDGRIMQVEKVPISSAILRKYVRVSVLNYFLLDGNAFVDERGNPIKVDPNNYKEFLSTLLKSSPRIFYLSNFFDVKNRQSVSSMYYFLKYLYGLFKAGKLPDIIKGKGYVQNEDMKTDGSSFTYTASIPVSVSYIGIDGKWHGGEGVIDIKIDGYFNPLKTTELNPYGMKVKTLTVSWITVNDNE